MAKKKKIRVALRKNRQNTPRQRGQRAREIDADRSPDSLTADERPARKGAITRYRTIISSDGADAAPVRDVDQSACLAGRVISPRGGEYLVEADDGSIYECAGRRLLQSLASDDR